MQITKLGTIPNAENPVLQQQKQANIFIEGKPAHYFVQYEIWLI
jgi:hypothetical protein